MMADADILPLSTHHNSIGTLDLPANGESVNIASSCHLETHNPETTTVFSECDEKIINTLSFRSKKTLTDIICRLHQTHDTTDICDDKSVNADTVAQEVVAEPVADEKPPLDCNSESEVKSREQTPEEDVGSKSATLKSSPVWREDRTVLRSRYGRLHKPKQRPDMEFIPLVRSKAVKNLSDPVRPVRRRGGLKKRENVSEEISSNTKELKAEDKENDGDEGVKLCLSSKASEPTRSVLNGSLTEKVSTEQNKQKNENTSTKETEAKKEQTEEDAEEAVQSIDNKTQENESPNSKRSRKQKEPSKTRLILRQCEMPSTEDLEGELEIPAFETVCEEKPITEENSEEPLSEPDDEADIAVPMTENHTAESVSEFSVVATDEVQKDSVSGKSDGVQDRAVLKNAKSLETPPSGTKQKRKQQKPTKLEQSDTIDDTNSQDSLEGNGATDLIPAENTAPCRRSNRRLFSKLSRSFQKGEVVDYSYDFAEGLPYITSTPSKKRQYQSKKKHDAMKSLEEDTAGLGSEILSEEKESADDLSKSSKSYSVKECRLENERPVLVIKCSENSGMRDFKEPPLKKRKVLGEKHQKSRKTTKYHKKGKVLSESTSEPAVFNGSHDAVTLINEKYKIRINSDNSSTNISFGLSLNTSIPRIVEPPQYLVGDLLWSKIGNFAFWPCMVSFDPVQGIYTKIFKEKHRIYHVQYFGEEVVRGWTQPRRIFPYKGLAQFQETAESIVKNSPLKGTARKKLIDFYTVNVKGKRKESFTKALEEADEALEMTRQERKANLTFVYENAPENAASEVGKIEKGKQDISKMSLKNTFTDKAEKINSSLNRSKLSLKKEKRKRVESSDSTSDDTVHDPSDRIKLSKPTAFQKDLLSKADSEDSQESFVLKKNRLIDNGLKEKICNICEEMGNIITCQGQCQQSFHLQCIGLTQAPADFKCDECTTGRHQCFLCKSAEGDVRKCTTSLCGKFYHQSCLKQLSLPMKIEGRLMICPHHHCLSCYNDNPKTASLSKGRLLKCIHCPVAYHAGNTCIAAGAKVLNMYNIVCARHFEAQKNRPAQTHINTNWCFICSIGGNLICCESCPASFHPECLGLNQMPDEHYFCEDCKSEKHPRFGDIVWIKLGCYRWWPAKVCHPSTVPQNIQNLDHSIGEFPVQFFGSHDYYWTHKGRVFLYQDGDKGGTDYNHTKNISKVFQKALQEANDAYKEWKAAKEARIAEEANKASLKPPAFKVIKMNKAVGKVQANSPLNVSDIQVCECNPNSENPCSSEMDCLNRMILCECQPEFCPAGSRCQNRRFQNMEYISAAPFKTEGRGWGLKTLQDVKKGQFVMEYVGELIDEEECERRLKKMNQESGSNFYFLTIEKDRIIDAGPKGNLSRFMNHSCQPNCETQKWSVSGETRVGLFSIKDIPAGSELTFNYNLDCRGNEKTKCSCNAPNCSGFLGVRPKILPLSPRKKKLHKQRKPRVAVVKHEDACFRCDRGGALVLCDRKGCTKAYHLGCLQLEKTPHGRWECPWHHCDICGCNAVSLCNECPNSFCKEHATPDVIYPQKDGTLICNEHVVDGV